MSQVKRDVSLETVDLIRNAQAAVVSAQLGLDALCAGIVATLGLQGRIVGADPGVAGKRKPFLTIVLADESKKAAKGGKEKKE